MRKHTPGPWSASELDARQEVSEYYIFIEPGVAVIERKIKGHDECDLADARLIAAAPEQHEANKASLMVLCALLDANDWHPNVRKDIEFAINANRSAIAKATGEQQ